MKYRLFVFAVLRLPASLATAQELRQSDTDTPEIRQKETSTFHLPALGEQPSASPGQLSQAPSVFVQQIEVSGVSAFDRGDIDAITRPYTNRQVSSADLLALRAALSQNYLEHNFINSGVILPDQRIVNGVVSFRAVEGVLTRVEIEGDNHLNSRYLEGRLRRHLDEPLNIADIQYALRYLQNDPNVDRLDAELSPGDAPGESVLRLAVDEPPRFRAGIGVDNYSSTSTGAEQATAYFSSRNLTGFGDVLNLSLGVSDGAENYSASLAAPITRRNTQIQFYGSRSDASIIEDRFAALDIESQTDTWGVSLTQPVVDNLNTTLSLVLGYEDKHSETALLGIPFSFSPGAQNGESDTSVGQFAIDWTTRGTNFVFALRGNYRNGMDSGDATVFEPTTDEERLLNPTGADGVFDVLQAQVLFLRRLNTFSLFSALHDRGQFVFRTTSQFSGDPLMSLEKLAIGGVNTVRGYPENLLVRDNGVAATVELQIPLPGYSDTPSPRNLMVVPFLDYGRSWNDIDTDPNPLRNTDDAKYIVGLGLGLIWEPVDGLRAQVFWGAGVGDNFAPGDDPRDFRDNDLQDDGIHISITYMATW